MKAKNVFVLIALLCALLLVACSGDSNEIAGDNDGSSNGNSGQSEEAGFVGISMPTQSSARWISDGNNLVEQLEALGFRTTLQYAEDIVENQVAQIENMIAQGVDILVIAAVDGGALTSVLAQAAEENIYVIAYDRLIMNSEHVSYYATFDNLGVGVMQGEFIVNALGINAGATGPFNVELFAGAPDDNNAHFFFDGAMSVLRPYIESGVIHILSQQDTMEQVATIRWNAAYAQSRMENLLTANFQDVRVDAILSPYDGLTLGIISALRGAGYGTSEQPWPIITGQDALVPAIISIRAEEQTQTIFKDTRILASRTVDMINALLNGESATVNDTETYDNGMIIVPTYLIEPIEVTIDNWYEVLVSSGFYTEDELE